MFSWEIIDVSWCGWTCVTPKSKSSSKSGIQMWSTHCPVSSGLGSWLSVCARCFWTARGSAIEERRRGEDRDQRFKRCSLKERRNLSRPWEVDFWGRNLLKDKGSQRRNFGERQHFLNDHVDAGENPYTEKHSTTRILLDLKIKGVHREEIKTHIKG